MKDFYMEKGYYIHNDPVVPKELLEKAFKRIPYIYEGEYDLGFPPARRWNLGSLTSIQKIDQVHRCDKAFHDLVTCAKLYDHVAQVSGARMLQVWGTQLIIKPPGGGDEGNIGWHSDEVNWYWLDGNLFTIWLPLVDVNVDNGTIAYIPGSHKLNIDFEIDDAYTQDLEGIERKIKDQYSEIDLTPTYANIKSGCFAMHDKKTMHASMNNVSDSARISLAINVRTEDSSCLYDKDDIGYLKDIDNPVFSPVVYYKHFK